MAQYPDDKRVLSISLESLNPRRLEPMMIIVLLDTRVAINLDLFFGGLLGFA
jgi:hypothetical protein